MWGIVLVAVGVVAMWHGLTAKEFYIRGGDGGGSDWKVPSWLGRPIGLLIGGLAIWKGISLLLK